MNTYILLHAMQRTGGRDGSSRGAVEATRRSIEGELLCLKDHIAGRQCRCHFYPFAFCIGDGIYAVVAGVSRGSSRGGV